MSEPGHHADKSSPRWHLIVLLLVLACVAAPLWLTDWQAASPAPPPDGSAASPVSRPHDLPTELRGSVVQVLDGDSIVVKIDGVRQQLRMQGIDCPEHGQAFGNRAKQLTRKLALHKEVTIESVGRDQYDRILGHPRLPDGSRLDYELVREGMAWWYRHYSDDPRLGALEAEARRQKRGLWKDPQPVPPWTWRRAHRQ